MNFWLKMASTVASRELLKICPYNNKCTTYQVSKIHHLIPRVKGTLFLLRYINTLFFAISGNKIKSVQIIEYRATNGL